MHPALPALLALSALAAANPSVLPADFHRFAPRQSVIQWQPCNNDTSSTMECGRFEVPLDWANEAAGKASLYVVRYPATNLPKLGTLFTNPGGPGGSGVKDVLNTGPETMKAVDGKYDLVSWDPRGVGASYPRTDCFATGSEENAFWEGTIPRAGLEARGNFTDPADLEAFYAQVPEVDRLLTELGQKCMKYSPDSLQYVGSAAAVRDMVALHDYLEGSDKPLNYWGFSYGTVIGIYFVNMFPSRVGRVVLDGVVDPVYWANRPSYQIWSIFAESTDEALTGFVQACAAAGPTNCAIASVESTPDSLREDLWRLIDQAYDYKKSVGVNAQFGSASIRSLLFSGMYNPTQWPKLAEDILAFQQFLENYTSPTKRSLPPLPDKRQATNLDPAPPYAIQAITCADSMDPGNTTTRDVFDELVRVTRDVSQMFGPSWGAAGFHCHRWPARAVERYVGPWNKQLANPILVIGNEADPVTPFISAKNVADALGDSAVLVEQDDYGHLSWAMHSDCTFKILENYFLKNELPSTDQFCGTNQQLFPGPGVTKASLSALYSSDKNTSTSTNATELHLQLEKEHEHTRQLVLTVIALACATGLLLLSLIASCVIGKKGSGTKRDVVYWGKEDESEQGHKYKTPYDGATPLKLGGGYTPVKT